MRSRAGAIANDHARLASTPKQESALLIGRMSTTLSVAENAVLTQILSILHDPAFGRLFRCSGPTAASLSAATYPYDGGWKAPESPLLVALDNDPVHKAYLDLALAGEENLELIPRLADYLSEPSVFLNALRQNLNGYDEGGYLASLAEKTAALEQLLQQHPDVDLSGFIAHPGLRRNVIYMDSADYDVLFAVRSQTRVNHAVLQADERLKNEPLIVQVLQLMLSLIKTDGRVPEAVIQKHWADVGAVIA